MTGYILLPLSMIYHLLSQEHHQKVVSAVSRLSALFPKIDLRVSRLSYSKCPQFLASFLFLSFTTSVVFVVIVCRLESTLAFLARVHGMLIIIREPASRYKSILFSIPYQQALLSYAPYQSSC